jgi:hypothetical protein
VPLAHPSDTTSAPLPRCDSAGESTSDGALEGREAAFNFYTNKSRRLACEKPRLGLRLRSSDGRFACVRCGLNDCSGCYGMKSLIRAQMVYEDSLVEQPRYAITLTTRDPIWDAERYRRGKEKLLAALRAELGRVEVLEFIEQTTGRAPRSGGHRRGHGHNLVKCDVPGAVLEIERITRRVWKEALGAWHVNVVELQSAGGAVGYLTLNLALEKGKRVQAPTGLPKGTRTLRPTQAYWSVSPDELRERARDHHAARRLRHSLAARLTAGDGHVSEELLELWFEFEWERHQARTWELWEVRERSGSTAFDPVGPAGGVPEGEGTAYRAGRLVNMTSGEVL